MNSKYLIGLPLAILSGAACGASVWLNASTLNNGVFEINEVTAIPIILTTMAALFSVSLDCIWQRSKVRAVLALLVTIICSATSIYLSTNRIGALDSSAKQSIVNNNARITRADAAIARLNEKLDKRRTVAGSQCPGIDDWKKKEARKAKPRKVHHMWPECLKAKHLINTYEAELEAALIKRDSLGETVQVTNHWELLLTLIAGKRVSETSNIWTPAVIAGVFEAGTVLALSLAGMFFSEQAPAQRIVDVTAAYRQAAPASSSGAVRRRLTRRQLIILAELQARPSISNRELADRLGWPETTTSRIARKLKSRGHIDRSKSGKETASVILLAAQ